MSNLYNENGIVLMHNKQSEPNAEDFFLHVHDTYEILCFVSGNVKYLVEGREYSMYPGCIMLMRPAETHKLIVRGDESYERYVLNFRADCLKEIGCSEDILTAFNDRALGVKNQYLPNEFCGIEPLNLFKQLASECKSLREPRSAVVVNLAALLLAVNTAFPNKGGRDGNSEADEAGKEIIDYINVNITSELSLEAVSEHVHMSTSQVERIFRKLTGTSVYDYVLSKRLVMVRELISDGEGAMSASLKCGFRDYSSFYRLYKKRVGCAPSDAKSKK